MLRKAWMCVLVAAPALAAAPISIVVDEGGVLAKTSPDLTSVTIDICALKQGLNFSDTLLQEYAKHLAPAVLRIGGTDQNHFSYDMKSQDPLSPCKCGDKHAKCVMTASYWQSVHDFAENTGLKLIFGLTPNDLDNALSLVYHTAHQNYSSMLAWSYGNEQTGDETLAAQYLKDMTAVRQALFRAYPAETSVKTRPLLIGADTGIGPMSIGLDPSDLFNDQKHVAQHLLWMRTFVSTCAKVIDAVSWHTYDYRAGEIGAEDHQPLPWPPVGANVSRLFDPTFHDIAARLADNVSGLVAEVAPTLGLPVWLTETNSICHQGTFNVTNAFFNSLWLVDRFGMMAERGMQLMARQSFIGYNYSLLGNFPEEPIFAAPDFYTTVLFKRIAGDVVLSNSHSSGAPATLRTYAFCSREAVGGVALAMVNLDETRAVTVNITLRGPYDKYVLAPSSPEKSPRLRATSRVMELNGLPLVSGSRGELPDLSPRVQQDPQGAAEVMLEPLTFAFFVFKEAGAQACGAGEANYV